MTGRRLTAYAEPADEGPIATHDGLLSIAVGQVGRSGVWRVLVTLEARSHVAEGELISADFDAIEAGTIVAALEAARTDVLRRMADG